MLTRLEDGNVATDETIFICYVSCEHFIELIAHVASMTMGRFINSLRSLYLVDPVITNAIFAALVLFTIHFLHLKTIDWVELD